MARLIWKVNYIVIGRRNSVYKEKPIKKNINKDKKTTTSKEMIKSFMMDNIQK